ncbi:unnamed protein product [Cylicostephanus goldi]|uniref:Uncharacterized protein n=1 Tax=Cylicostephanus goldi TaxID=71465 RepID=A0A3P6RU42_CYLGO|nr:unnamed protein product [Cylicostephanus goldi]
MDAVTTMHTALGLDDIGFLHHAPVICGDCVFLITVRFVGSKERDRLVQTMTLRWLSFDKLLKKKSDSPLISTLITESMNIMNFYESSQITLKKLV